MDDTHTTHCCIVHGCKYGEEDCDVANGREKQAYGCEQCGLEAEGYYGHKKPPSWQKEWVLRERKEAPAESTGGDNDSISNTAANLAAEALLSAGIIRERDMLSCVSIIEEEFHCRMIIEGLSNEQKINPSS